MPRPLLPPRRRAAFASIAALALAVTAALAGTTVASAASAPAVTACSVKNVTTGATSSSLKTAVKAAKAGAKLQVSGTCKGGVTLSRTLTLTGKHGATIKGGGPVLTIAAGAKVKVTGVTITGGRAPACIEWTAFVCGGGIYNKGTLTLDRVTVRGNVAQPKTSATINSAWAAGIYNAPSGRMVIGRSTISDNHAIAAPDGWAQGGGIGNDGTLTVRSSTISGNLTEGAESQGAGIYNEGTDTNIGHNTIGSLTLENTTISGNDAGEAAGQGGGLFADPYVAKTDLTFVSIVANQARTGGGLYLKASASLVATLVTDNTGALASPDCYSTGTIDADRSFIGAVDGCTISGAGDFNLTGTTASPLPAGIGSLSANGGPTDTHALLNTSVAIDGAAYTPCPLGKDQRGVSRPQGLTCDIGAFEKQ
ncbi:MAG: choice-of-anchor Q domain-containing protein [Chloroflexota bacterium]